MSLQCATTASECNEDDIDDGQFAQINRKPVLENCWMTYIYTWDGQGACWGLVVTCTLSFNRSFNHIEFVSNIGTICLRFLIRTWHMGWCIVAYDINEWHAHLSPPNPWSTNPNSILSSWYTSIHTVLVVCKDE